MMLCVISSNASFNNGKWLVEEDDYTLTSYSDYTSNAAQMFINNNGFSGNSNITEKNVKMYVGLNFGEQFLYGFDNAHPFSFSVNVNVAGNGFSFSKTCILTNNQPESGFITNITGKFLDLSSVTISFSSVNLAVGNSVLVNQADLLGKLHLKLRYEVDLGVNVTSITSVADPVSFSGKQAYFSWSNLSDLADLYTVPNYEIQIVRLYNLCSGPGITLSNEREIYSALDWSGALKIETQSSEPNFTLNIAEGQGFYAWRVRPVGSSNERGYANPANLGSFDDNNLQDLPVSIDCSSPALNKLDANAGTNNLNNFHNYIFFYQEIDDDKNFTHERVFTEQNRIKEVINYGTYLGQSKQIQTYLPSQNAEIVAQQVFDYSGRPSLAPLPLPVRGQNFSGYKTGMVKSSSTQLYTADNFDKNDNYKNPAQMQGPISDYYNGSNTDNGYPLAGAGGYPFARTIFSEDGSGRHKESSGIGAELRIGFSNTDIKDIRTTRTSYSKPSEIELIRLFGDEAPSAEGVFKTAIIDPNNTTSITYTDKSGKVIATCLAVSENDRNNLLPVTDDASIPFSVHNSIVTNNKINEDVVSSYRLSLVEPSDVYISYKNKCENQFGQGCSSGDCKYMIKYTISNINNPQQVFSTTPVSLNCNGSDDIFITDIGLIEACSCAACSTGSACKITSAGFTASTGPAALSSDGVTGIKFPAGDFMIEKHLILDQGSADELLRNNNGNIDAVSAYIQILGRVIGSIENKDDLADFISSKLPGFNPCDVNLYGDINDKNEDHVCDYDFSDAASWGAQINPTTHQFDVTTSCCGTVSASMAGFTQEEHDCSLSVTQNWQNYVYQQTPRGSMDFYGYMADNMEDIVYKQLLERDYEDADARTEAQSWTSNILGSTSNYMQNYEPNEFNAMIYHMLNDKYFTGNAYLDGSVWKKADEFGNPDPSPSAAAPVTPIVQYDCKQVWDCWTTVVSSFVQTMIQADPPGDSHPSLANVGSSADKSTNQENHDPNDTNVSDDHLDNSDGAKTDAFTKWLVDRKMSKVMRDNPDVEVKLDLVYQFLDCIGYKFAQIRVFNHNGGNFDCASPLTNSAFFYLDGNGHPYTDVANTADLPPCSLNTYIPFVIETQSGQCHSTCTTMVCTTYTCRPIKRNITDREYDTYLTDRVFAFKYFVYTDENPASTNNDGAEVASCFYANATSASELAETDMCRPVRCIHGYETWSMGQRNTFYNMLKFGSAMPPPDDESAVNTATECDIPVYVSEKNSVCSTACERRRDAFRNAIMNKLVDRCYTIGGCSSDEGTVTYEEIEYMTDKLVMECQNNYCNLVNADVSCESVTCTMVFGARAGNNISYNNYAITNPCKELMIKQAESWDFDVDFTPVPGCTRQINYTQTLFAEGSSGSSATVNVNSVNPTISSEESDECAPSPGNPNGSINYDYSPVRVISIHHP